MIIWGGLMSLSDNAKGDSSFGWQIILFTFVLATVLLTINPDHLSSPRQKTAFKTTGFLMIFSGTIMIGGYGMFTSGFAKATEHPWSAAIFGLGGLATLIASWVLLALGLSIMAVESAEILLEALEGKQQ